MGNLAEVPLGRKRLEKFKKTAEKRQKSAKRRKFPGYAKQPCARVLNDAIIRAVSLIPRASRRVGEARCAASVQWPARLFALCAGERAACACVPLGRRSRVTRLSPNSDRMSPSCAGTLRGTKLGHELRSGFRSSRPLVRFSFASPSCFR